MIEIKDLTFQYSDAVILKSINLRLQDNSLNAVIGLNGAGKTTLFRCLLRLENVPRNTVFFDEKDVTLLSVRDMAKYIAFMPQISKISHSNILARDYIVEARTPYLKPFAVPSQSDYNIVDDVAVKLDIVPLLDRMMHTLSGGEAQLVSLARALTQQTKVIIMDEPTSALDLVNQHKALALIKRMHEEGKTIIFSTHDPNQALRISADVCLLKDGELFAHGSAHDVLTNENVRAIYGESVDLIDRGGCKMCVMSSV